MKKFLSYLDAQSPFRSVIQRVRSWLIPVLLVATLLGAGCGTPRARYKVLSFFFDGVPDPDELAANAGRGAVRTSDGGQMYVHKPFAEEKCDTCHENTDDIFARAQVPPQACLKCHTTVLNAYSQMHGPVASSYCFKCHQGHQSENRYLLTEAGSKLCTQCHSVQDLSQKVSEHSEPKTSCMTCHSGHGGQTSKMLKVTAAPTTAPITVEVRQ